MSSEIVLQEADLAITDLTITSEREGAVDFTMPFMNLGTTLSNCSKFYEILVFNSVSQFRLLNAMNEISRRGS